MALIKFGPMVLDARGSIGGVTISRNSSGSYARARVKPVNPNTERQDNVRSAMAFLTARWSQTVTDAQRIGWNLYASSVSMKNKLGESIFNSGFNHYIRSNIILKLAYDVIVDAPPVVFELPAQDPTLSLTASEAAQEISTDYDDGMDWAKETGGHLWVFQGKPQNPQRNFFGGPWRLLTSVSGADGAPPPGPKVASVHFAIAELQRQWIYARIQRADGRISETFEADAFVAA